MIPVRRATAPQRRRRRLVTAGQEGTDPLRASQPVPSLAQVLIQPFTAGQDFAQQQQLVLFIVLPDPR